MDPTAKESASAEELNAGRTPDDAPEPEPVEEIDWGGLSDMIRGEEDGIFADEPEPEPEPAPANEYEGSADDDGEATEQQSGGEADSAEGEQEGAEAEGSQADAPAAEAEGEGEGEGSEGDAASAAAPEQEEQASGEAAAAPDLSVYRQQAIEHLQHTYGLTEEEQQEFDNDPNALISKKLAQVHVNAFEAAVNHMMRALPQAMDAVNNQREARNSFESRLYGRWPALAEHKQTVQKVMDVYRQVRPDASEEELINDVGLQASVQLKLPIQGTGNSNGGNSGEQPAAPRKQSSGTRRHKPANPSPSARPAPTRSEWDEIIDEPE